MKFVRSILAIILGWLAVFLIVGVNESLVSPLVYSLPESIDRKNMQAVQAEMARNPPPDEAYAVILAGWSVGAFVGGALSALIATGGRCIHAGVIGGFVLALSAAMMMMLPHPDWMKVAGLLLPLPISLLAGKLVSQCCATSPPSNP